jgi:hypothetical protein
MALHRPGRFLSALAMLLLSMVPTSLTASEPGLLDLQVEESTGKVNVRFNQLPAEFLYVPALQSGTGSSDLELDRGQLDRTRLVRFERYGNRVLLLEPNLKFRAVTTNIAERRAVREAFAQSVLAGFPIEKSAEGTAEAEPDDAVVIDLSPLLLSDVTRISAVLSGLEQGTFTMDAERSAVDTAQIRNFPQNTLIPVVVTLAGSEPGAFVQDVTPTADSMTVRVMHQFVQLPDSHYRPRSFHPRSGFFELTYRDYAAALDEPVDRRHIFRHRLAAGDTLQYYVDSGAPEPIRSALLEGASWWSEAFAAAGFENGFTVDILPEGADPLDIRYNVIQWVHRSTRGWSYGSNVSDPRSGEIIKGHVSLGSLRVRQDQLIAQAPTAPFSSAGDGPAASRDMGLARLRQLSAHEVGHTLGLSHNFAASSAGDRSVMDYPHPDLYLDQAGKVRLDRAYAKGVSSWDKLAVRYGYSEFGAGQEEPELAGILGEARQKNLLFITDRDARIPGSAHPAAHLWDNGSDVLARLDELLKVRQVGLNNFSAAVIPDGTPLFEMERRLVPVYLLHRYQLEATAKLLGGLYYDYALKDGRRVELAPVDARMQREALAALISLLRPERLALPENLRYLIPPPAAGHDRDREFFPAQTGMTFDHLSPARAGANLVIAELLQPQRLARLSEQHALRGELPGMSAVFDALLDISWGADIHREPYLAAIQEEVNWRLLRGLMSLSLDASASDRVRGTTIALLISLSDQLQSKARKGDEHAIAVRQQILRFLDRAEAETQEAPDPAPPGSPIGP